MEWSWNQVVAGINTPWFTIGDTPITSIRMFGLVFILIFVWWLASMLEQTLRRMHGHAGRTVSSSTAYAFARIVRYVVWIIGTIVGLNYLGFDLKSFALVGGAIGVGIGLGLQNLFSNVVSGIIILLEKTLKVGDFVDLQHGLVGTVTEIGVRYTRITTNDEADVLVPNSEFVNGRVTNWTYGGSVRRLGIPFTVAYGSDKEAVREAAIAAATKVEGLLSDERHQSHVVMRGLGDNGLEFEVGIWLGPRLVDRPGAARSMCVWALEEELTKRGITIPAAPKEVIVRGPAEGAVAA